MKERATTCPSSLMVGSAEITRFLDPRVRIQDFFSRSDDEDRETMNYLFSKPIYNCVGDPYHDPPLNPYQRAMKGHFQTGASSTTFSFVPSYLQGKDVYEDQFKILAAERKGSIRKFLTPTGFSYPSPAKRSATPGDNNGTFRGRIEYVPMLAAKEKGKPLDANAVTRRNIRTAPSKRGGPGVANTLIGGKDIEYVGSDYMAYDEAVRRAKKWHRAKVGDRKAFSSATKQREFFDSYPGCGVSRIYSSDEGALPPKKDEDVAKARSIAANLANGNARDDDKKLHKVFRPTSPPRGGFNSTLSPYPEALPEQFNDRERRFAVMPARRQPSQVTSRCLPVHLKDRKPFRPTSTPRSSLTRPICTMRIRA